MNYLHKRGIVHRNIRTGNILFSELGKLNLKLIDFDVAGTKTIETVMIYGGKGGLHGPYYCAPEIFNNEASDRSDIWSAGVVLYFLLYGCLPFDGAFDDAIDRIKRGRFDLDRAGAAVSHEAKDLIRLMFSVN